MCIKQHLPALLLLHLLLLPGRCLCSTSEHHQQDQTTVQTTHLQVRQSPASLITQDRLARIDTHKSCAIKHTLQFASDYHFVSWMHVTANGYKLEVLCLLLSECTAHLSICFASASVRPHHDCTPVAVMPLLLQHLLLAPQLLCHCWHGPHSLVSAEHLHLL